MILYREKFYPYMAYMGKAEDQGKGRGLPGLTPGIFRNGTGPRDEILIRGHLKKRLRCSVPMRGPPNPKG
ncbi:MAG: hypothetical protein C6W57_05030 [Caldibacillus debilis]|nr:MAG: hypothetical protein C6W57_05030 [Caldibacillus debilis]